MSGLRYGKAQLEKGSAGQEGEVEKRYSAATACVFDCVGKLN